MNPQSPKMTIKVEKIKLKSSDTTFKYRIVFTQNGKYKINNENIDINNYKETLTVDEIESIYYVTKHKSAEYFINNETDEKIDYSEYLKQREKIYKNYDDTTEKWNTLQNEYKYKLFIASWKSFFKEEEILIDVEPNFDSTYILDTEDEYITSDYFLGKTSPMCSFKINKFVKDTFKEKCLSIGLEESEKKGKTFHISTNSGLRFSKIDSSYIFDPSWEYKNDFRGDLDACLKRKNELKTSIVDIINKQYNVRFLNTELDRLQTISSLKAILKEIKGIDSKVSTSSKKNKVINDVENLIEKIYS